MNNSSPTGRPPFIPCLPAGEAVYAIGDIHGHLDLLEQLLNLIAVDVTDKDWSRVSLVFLGDFIDRGPQSQAVVERLRQGPRPGPLAATRWICLIGNHEQVMLNFLDDVAAGQMWLRHGGLETVRSYLNEPPLPGWQHDTAGVQALLQRHLPVAHRDFLANLPLSHQIGDYFFVHAGIRPGIALDSQDQTDLTWIRHEFLQDRRWHGKVVVHGHTPSPQPESLFNRIGVDTGAYASGRLSAVVLNGSGRRFLGT